VKLLIFSVTARDVLRFLPKNPVKPGYFIDIQVNKYYQAGRECLEQ